MRTTLAILIALTCMTGLRGQTLQRQGPPPPPSRAAVLGVLGVLTNGKAVGIAGGALLDGLAGNAIARDMDCEDHPYAARAYGQSFRGPVGRRYEWSRGRNRGYVVTNREYNRGPRLCRDFTQVVYRRGREFDRAGTACRRRDGEWEFLS
jgi:surface antigen